MQSTARCPRCGYVLSYNGYIYYCSFCGYPQTKRGLTASIQSFERSVRARIERALVEFKPKMQRPTNYYPINIVMQPCIHCGFNFPRGVQLCPSCGAQRSATSQSTPVPLENTGPQGIDRRIFDYITEHGGTISLSQASQDLVISQSVLLSAIERLKGGGFLDQS